MNDAKTIAEQNSILRTPRSTVKRLRAEDAFVRPEFCHTVWLASVVDSCFQSADEPLSKKLKTPSFTARNVPASLYQADITVKTTKRMADLTNHNNRKVTFRSPFRIRIRVNF